MSTLSAAPRVRPTLHLVPPTAEFLTVEEFATILRLPSTTAHELARRGAIPSVKLGRRRRIRRDFVDGLGRDGTPTPSEPPLTYSDLPRIASPADWLTVEETAAILGQPLSTTYEQVRVGVIPSVKLGKHRRVRRDVINNLAR